MEQKKTLWIVAASGVFLLVVIGAAMILYSPSNYSKPTPTVIAHTPVQPIQTNQWNNVQERTQETSAPSSVVQKDLAENIPMQPQQVENLTVISGTTNVYGIDTIPKNIETTTIDLNELKSIAEKEQRTKSSSTTENTVAKKPVTSERKEVRKTPSTKTVPAVSSTTATPKYWVQAVAFTSKKLAENSRSVLAENKIPAEIFTHTSSNNQVFYRVRVGPYTTKTEAEFWKNKIMQISDFRDAKPYVTQSASK